MLVTEMDNYFFGAVLNCIAGSHFSLGYLQGWAFYRTTLFNNTPSILYNKIYQMIFKKAKGFYRRQKEKKHGYIVEHRK